MLPDIDFNNSKLLCLFTITTIKINEKTLSATDVLAPMSMKNAAKCDTSCELQNQ